MTLYHFTCAHGKRDIGTGPRAVLIPHYHPLIGAKLLWLTSLPDPEEDEVGLTMANISCDRREHRYVVDEGVAAGCRWWLEAPEREAAPPRVVLDLESYGKPETWWISSAPVVARYDRSYRRAA